MNILDFDNWIKTNEGFTADVEDDSANNKEEEKNEIDIEVEKDHNITYTIIGDRVTSKETIKNKDINNNSIGASQNTIETEIDDIKLKKDIINASNAIKDIKERERAKEILRLTGGDENTPVSKFIIGIYDDPNSNEIRRKHTDVNGETIDYSLYAEIEKLEPNFWKKTGSYCYLPLIDITGQNGISIDITKTYNTIINTVGKGEFLLSLLFTDIYKHKAHGYKKYDNDTLSIGDNYILHVDNNIEHIYELEVKGKNAGFAFDKDNIHAQKLQLKNGKYRIYNKHSNDEDYKNAIVSRFLKYLKIQSGKRKNLCVCFFDVEGDIPKGILFVNASQAKNINVLDTTTDLFTTFKELIHIIPEDKKGKRSCNTAYHFEYAASGLKINCTLNNEIYDKKYIKRVYKHKDTIEPELHHENSSIIYNFENFINEIYTK